MLAPSPAHTHTRDKDDDDGAFVEEDDERAGESPVREGRRSVAYVPLGQKEDKDAQETTACSHLCGASARFDSRPSPLFWLCV